MSKSFHTKCIHGNDISYDHTGAVSVPIFQTATFAHHELGVSTGFDYSRIQNPTREHLEKTLAGLEGGLDSIAFSTGMAAINAVMAMFEDGDHIVASADLYGGSLRLFRMVAMKKGITFDFVDTGNIEEVKKAIKTSTKAVYVETPTNPMMQVTNIKDVALLTKEAGIKLIVDNTFMTPYFQKPLSLGADLVIHSGTKYLGGHNDTLAGIVVVKDPDDLDQLRLIAKTLGGCLSPFDAWLIIRGIKTLPIRMDRQAASAMILAKWLKDQKWVNKIYYIGLEDDPGHETMVKQASGFGSMISIEVTDFQMAKALLNHVKIIQFAESLGGVETLMTYPKTQTHADVPEEEREAKGINDCLIRISVGLEDPDDLIEDLDQASRA